MESSSTAANKRVHPAQVAGAWRSREKGMDAGVAAGRVQRKGAGRAANSVPRIHKSTCLFSRPPSPTSDSIMVKWKVCHCAKKLTLTTRYRSDESGLPMELVPSGSG